MVKHIQLDKENKTKLNNDRQYVTKLKLIISILVIIKLSNT